MPTTISVQNRISRSFNDYQQYLACTAAFVVPVTLAAVLSTPWVAVPVAIGAAFAGGGIAFEKRDEYEKSKTKIIPGAFAVGVAVASVLGGVSYGIKQVLPDLDVDLGVRQKLNSTCWKPGQEFDVFANGKNYHVTLPNYPIPNTTEAIGYLTNGETLTTQSHKTGAFVKFPYHNFWTGKVEPKETEQYITSVKRPGAWNPEADIIQTYKGSETLKCG